MKAWNNFKSYFSKSSMQHERGSGGMNSNPFFAMYNFVANLFGRFWGTQIDYAKETGELTQSRLIMAAVNFLGRTLPEAKLEVVRPKSDGTMKVVPDHPLVKLFKRPNKYFTGDLFLKAMGLSWIISGNVFLYKVRNMLGEVIELWYIPHHQIEPRWEGGDFISYYAYAVDGYEHHLKPEDVIHLRNGIDPHNTRMGLSDIASALREIYTDNEAANFSALLMKNSGVPPFVISPKESQANMKKEDRERIADQFRRKSSGDERGKPVVNSIAIEVTKTGFSPDEMNLTELRRLPEETISSLTGIPAIVLQFGAGLERATYSNYSEAREAAYESVIVPLWKYIAAELDCQLLSDFDKTGKLETRYNTSDVRILQDDENKLYTRVGAGYRTGIMKRSEARSKIGLEVDPKGADDVYFVEPKKEEKISDEKNDEKNDEKTDSKD